MAKIPSVSVVMPIFNAGQYLFPSMESVTGQTMTDIEIVCVNDGSTDGSLSVMKEFARYDGRVRVIDKPNGGYGHAMNVGIDAARGRYVMILEPDDFMDLGMVEALYGEAERLECDMVKSNYWEHEGATGTDSFENVLAGRQFGAVTNAMADPTIIHIRPSIWSGIYRRDMLVSNHIRFNETPGASYQDTSFAFKVLVASERVAFTSDAFLHYRIDNEASSVKSSGKVFSVCDEYAAMESFVCTSKERRERIMPMLQRYKFDTYEWNLNRVSDEFRELFRDRMALEFVKAHFDGFLDRSLFDDVQWSRLIGYVESYRPGTTRGW